LKYNRLFGEFLPVGYLPFKLKLLKYFDENIQDESSNYP
jgi:hypothetical protein